MPMIDLNYAQSLYNKPFNELLFKAQTVHRENFADEMELFVLLSIKTGSCPEDCKYCPQSAHYNADIQKEKLMDVESIVSQAQKAKDLGAKRFCMGLRGVTLPRKQCHNYLKLSNQLSH